jgi:phenylpropionate dioxygenase-like ring-hydroxylating dioxygenase large terminal subunit
MKVKKIRRDMGCRLNILLGMSYASQLEKFNNKNHLPEAWFWLAKSADVEAGKAIPAQFWGRELVIYRGDDGQVRAFDAYCPHMGAHLCDGKVEGKSLRCPFHFWKFSESGNCEEIPCQSDTRNVPNLKKYKVGEKYGLIWLWTGDADDRETIPVIPELTPYELDWTHGNQFVKNCHPNVVMINAIDAQHFNSVHNLIVNLNMDAKVLSPRTIQFSNTTPMPTKNFFLRWAARFYKKALTYEMTYWYGNTGSVMVGPDFLHFYILFALRPTVDGLTEGQTLLVTKKRAGLFGALTNQVLLFATKLVGNYFAKGDTVIFSRIRFHYQTPVKADRAIIQFIEHYEKQKEAPGWSQQVKPSISDGLKFHHAETTLL